MLDTTTEMQNNMSGFNPISRGDLTVKIANRQEEIEASKRLRYEVFCEEMGAKSNNPEDSNDSETDDFDAICDHLLVINNYNTTDSEVVGTYRLLRSDVMPKIGRFYTEDEYDITQLKNFNGNIMELGRSCVRQEFRTQPTIQLLWRGIGEYTSLHNIDLMFGCASFPSANADDHAEQLAYLKQYHSAPKEISPVALEKHYVTMDGPEILKENARKVFKDLPVLIKGYIRLGGYIGDGAVIDHEFNTTDVSIVVMTNKVSQKYVSRYAPESS